MKNIESKKDLLIRIERARTILAHELEVGFINQSDIFRAFSNGEHYRLSNNHDYRSNVIKNVVNSPFLLCDQDYLNIDIKKLLPIILKARYDMEVEELYALSENGDITVDELVELKELLKFSYYKSSEEGKQILKYGKVKSVVDNKLRTR